MNDVYNRKLRNNVIKFLEASTMSKTDFAKGVGMSKQTLNAWLKDERIISIRLEESIADFIIKYMQNLLKITKLNGKVEIESNDKKWLYT